LIAISRKPNASSFLRGRIKSQTTGATARSRFAVMGCFCGGLAGEFTGWLDIKDCSWASFYVDSLPGETCLIG
jgi:hypothetical protein